jgi:hypothetical protein
LACTAAAYYPGDDMVKPQTAAPLSRRAFLAQAAIAGAAIAGFERRPAAFQGRVPRFDPWRGLGIGFPD